MKATLITLALVAVVQFAAVGSAQIEVPNKDRKNELPHDVEQEVQTHANNVWTEVMRILDELGDSAGQPFPCEPVTVTVGINETNAQDPIDWNVWVRPECLPG